MVHVQFGLGKSGDEGVQIAGVIAWGVVVGQGFLPERRPCNAVGGTRVIG